MKKLIYFLISFFLLVSLMDVKMRAENNDKQEMYASVINYEEDSPLFFDDFSSAENFILNWKTIDGNSDDNTWYRETDAGYDGEPGYAKYYYNRTTGGDDYLITRNPISLQQGKASMVFYYKTSTNTNLEDFDVIMGTSDKPAEMKVIAEFNQYADNTWKMHVIDIDIEYSGEYYFGFYARSEPNKAGIWIDNVTISGTQYLRSPEIEIKDIILPQSNCSLADRAYIGATVYNSGTDVMDGFDLKYTVNGGEEINEHFNDIVAIYQSLTVIFQTQPDFSVADQIYDIVVTGECDGISDPDKNTVTGRVIHLSAATIPFVSDFSRENDLLGWNASETGSWIWEENIGAYTSEKESALLSGCVELKAGEYIFSFEYTAGFYFPSLDSYYYDRFEISYGKKGNDLTGFKVIKNYTQEYSTEKIRDDIKFIVEEDGEYIFAINSTSHANLKIYSVSIFDNDDHDIYINSFDLNEEIPWMIPQSQANREYSAQVTVKNKGKSIESGVKVELKSNEVVISTSEEVTLEPDASYIFHLTGKVNNVKANQELKLSAVASMLNPDGYEEDNIAEYIIQVSDSTFAKDKTIELETGYGSNSGTVAFGMFFDVINEDVLTSVNLGFKELNYAEDTQLNINIYERDLDSENHTLIISHTFLRELGGKPSNVVIPETTLMPGRYFFEVEQLTSVNMGLCVDNDPYGYYELYDKNRNEIVRFDTDGYLYIRPNFGNMTEVGIKDKSTSLVSIYPNPAIDILNIILPAVYNENATTIIICNVNGLEVKKIGYSPDINISDLPVGIYLIKISDGKNSEIVKLIKN